MNLYKQQGAVKWRNAHKGKAIALPFSIQPRADLDTQPLHLAPAARTVITEPLMLNPSVGILPMDVERKSHRPGLYIERTGIDQSSGVRRFGLNNSTSIFSKLNGNLGPSTFSLGRRRW